MRTLMKYHYSFLFLVLCCAAFFSLPGAAFSAPVRPLPDKNVSMRGQATMPVITAQMAGEVEERGLSYATPHLPPDPPAQEGTLAPPAGHEVPAAPASAIESAPSASTVAVKPAPSSQRTAETRGEPCLGKFSREALVGKKQAVAEQKNQEPGKESKKHTAKPAPDPYKKGTELAGGKLTFSGSIPDHPNDRLKPQRAPLPGNAQSMSREEPASAPEMSVSYKVADDTAARLTLNQQDETSPNYTPITKENSLVSTGVYVDLDVQDNLQLQMGGEVRSVEVDGPGDSRDSRETGASVGLRWSF